MPSHEGIGRVSVASSHQGPAVALAALVAALHLSVLAGRLRGRAMPGCGEVLSWQTPANGPSAERSTDKPPSNPVRTYHAGQLALDSGIVVIALAAWLHVMRINGSRGQ